MRLPLSTRFGLSVQQLEDRCTPAILVWDTAWNPLLPGTLPNAIDAANAANGQDEIQIDWATLGNSPLFTVPANQTLVVTDGVVINAGSNSGAAYAKFTGFRPFKFTHSKENGVTDSVINSGLFDTCIVPVATDSGGAIELTSGTLTLNYNRFVNNTARYGGAISISGGSTLVLGAQQGTPPAPSSYPEVAGKTGVHFQGNKAALDGGAIENTGGTVEIRRASFIENQALAGDGGAIDVWQSGVLTIAPFPNPGDDAGKLKNPDADFFRNSAQDGGAVHQLSGANSTITGANFVGNTATRDGGAIRLVNGTIDLTDSALTGNTAAGAGGGIAVGTLAGGGGTVNATNVAFQNNLAGVAGTNHRGWAGTGVFNDVNCTYVGPH